jgi:2'-5' RNA ligase
MDLALGGAGRFGDRVLWTRVLAAGSGPRGRSALDDLRALAASVGAAARRCRIAVDERPYRPHLTLARGRPGTDLRPLVEALREFVGTPWTADALHLVHSRLGAGPGGAAAHELIATWPLGRPAAPADPAPSAPTTGPFVGT